MKTNIANNILTDAKNYVAFFIDALYITLISAFLYLIILVGLHEIPIKGFNVLLQFFLSDIGIIITYCFMISFNATIQEVFFSTTLGKKICGLVVTNDRYERPKAIQIIIRNLVYPLDTLWVIGGFLLLIGNGKTFGGYISKTKLVNKKELKKLQGDMEIKI